MKKFLQLTVIILLLNITSVTVLAQDETAPVGIDAICGEVAIEITEADTLMDDEETETLDLLLRRLVTLPTEELPPLITFDPSLQESPAPGAVVFVDAPGQRYYRAIGVADIETCEPLDPTMPFAIGSHTKMFTAAVIYQLHEEGLLSVDDLVSDYLPDQVAMFEGGDAFTLNMLLSHTTGMPDLLNSDSLESQGMQLYDPNSGALERAFTPEEWVSDTADLEPMQFEPGTDRQWSYSNTGYIMLGMIIEQVTGQAYKDVIVGRIIEPLSLKNTFPVDEYATDDMGLPMTYVESPFNYVTSGWNYTQGWSAGNIVSTPEDMAAFLRALYSGELFENSETLGAMLTPASPEADDFTANFYYIHGGFYKHGFLGHGGQTLGFMSDFGYKPELDLVIGMWTNSAESYAGEGVYHIGQALGVTPSFDEVISEIVFGG